MDIPVPATALALATVVIVVLVGRWIYRRLEWDRTRVQLSSTAAVGVVIEGEPGICYEPGIYFVEPRHRDGTRYDGDDWSTRTFPIGWETVRWTGRLEDDWVIADALVQVTGPVPLWYRTNDVDAPVESVLGQCLREAVESGTTLDELEAGAIEEIASTYGIVVDELFVDPTTRDRYELETRTSELVGIEVLVEEDGPAPHERPGVLREVIADATASGDALTELDARTINERATTGDGLRVFEVERLSRSDDGRASTTDDVRRRRA